MTTSAVVRFAAIALTFTAPILYAQEAENSEFKQKFAALGWIHGPQHVELYGKSAIDLPAGYVFLNQAETSKLQTLTHNLSNGQQYFMAPEDFSWEAYFSFSEDGYVKDDDKIDADAILSNIKSATKAANEERRSRGWNEMEVSGWQTPPHYDASTRRLEWAVNGRDLKTGSTVVNFNTRLLGRTGVTSVVLLADPQTLDAAVPQFKQSLTAFSYLPGQTYAEYKPGDKVAKYGLAALITGGAAAIAVKTGFWKVLVGALAAGWKLIVAGLVAAGAAFKRFFKRGQT